MSKVFTTNRRLRFGDCDISGTAYFPSYLDILNGVNEEFFDHIGFPWDRMIRVERWGTPTVHLSCDFSRPSFFGDCLTFSLQVVRVGTSSVTFRHTVRCEAQPRWESTQVLAASDLDRHRSRPWPEAVKAALLACLGDNPASSV